VYVAPFADLLQLTPFPPPAWLAVVGIVIGTVMWSEPLKRPPKRVGWVVATSTPRR
jgi:hypothetical protein